MHQHGPARHAPPIVVVDDDPSARQLVRLYLRRAQLRNPVLEARDGGHAVELLGGLDVPPALVLLDVDMPTLSGLELLRWMRDHADLAPVPVVMLTGMAALDSVEQAYELGIVSYLVKPVGFAAMSDVLMRLDRPWILLNGEPPA